MILDSIPSVNQSTWYCHVPGNSQVSQMISLIHFLFIMVLCHKREYLIHKEARVYSNTKLIFPYIHSKKQQ